MNDKPRYRYSWKREQWTTSNGIGVQDSYTSRMLNAAMSADSDISKVRESSMPRIQQGFAIASILTGHAMMLSGEKVRDALDRGSCATIAQNTRR